MVEEARKINEKFVESGQAEFHLAHAENLPFENGSFNKIFTVNTIYFWDDPALVLSEIKRVLKPGGQFFVSIRPKSVMQHYPFSMYGFNLFSKDDLIDLLSEHHFKVKFTIEKVEPEQEISGEKMLIESLIVCAE
jgi:ubiquinone/menaquinone biosynthesis C-methylase UbiE